MSDLRHLDVLHSCPLFTGMPPDVIAAGHVSSPYVRDNKVYVKTPTGEERLPLPYYEEHHDDALAVSTTTTFTWVPIYTWTLPATFEPGDYFFAWDFDFRHSAANARAAFRAVVSGANALTIQAADGFAYEVECAQMPGDDTVWGQTLLVSLPNAGVNTVSVQMLNQVAGTLTVSTLALLLREILAWQ